jgi:hypothetical protein
MCVPIYKFKKERKKSALLHMGLFFSFSDKIRVVNLTSAEAPQWRRP